MSSPFHAWTKALVRHGLRKCGFELLHANGDPILAELRAIHETLRLNPGNTVHWADSLPQAAAHANLRHMIELHGINLLLDVGANRGQFAHLARRLGYRGEIFSFEPLARHQLQLKAAATRDGRWQVMPIAIGSTNAERELRVFNDDTFSSFHAINPAGQARFRDLVVQEQTERVSVRTLNSLWPELEKGAKRRVLLKTDTQGHDLAVLAGATDLLPSVRSVVTEAALQPIYAAAPLYPELVAWLGVHGLVPSGMFPISHRPDDLALIEMDAFFTRPIA